ncbi:MAG: hypothetical protein HY975_01930 [Candidatus Kerfeldbacteria bacterium]|nr:hypothetical protein [Candidatus Kerfeldbacteria bacterium]
MTPPVCSVTHDNYSMSIHDQSNEAPANFSDSITVPHAVPAADAAVVVQLTQDGILRQDIHVPDCHSPEFAQLLADAQSFTNEIVTGEHPAWPAKGVRWLNRLSMTLIGKLFSELTPNQRRAIAHAAITLAGHSELLA